MINDNFGFKGIVQIQCVSILLVLSVIYICLLTLMPLTFTFDQGISFLELYNRKFGSLSPYCCTPPWSLENVVSNLVLFVPFGMFLVSLQGISSSSLFKKMVLAGFASGFFSFSVETMQLFLPRYPSMVDLMLNTIGGIVGGMIGHYYFVPLSQWVQRICVNDIANQLMLVSVVVYVIFVILMYTVPLRSNFKNWDSSFRVHLGNEATLNRPWLGKIYLVALYDRSLLESEVFRNFQAGPYADWTHFRVRKGLLSLLDFSEGSGDVIHDRALVGPPLDFWIRDPEKVKWLRPNGIEIMGNTIISSKIPLKKFYDSQGYTHSELTIEVWIRPSHVWQKGPARIISYSRDPLSANFLLGQEKQNTTFRLRTPVTGLGGFEPELYTTDKPLSLELQHIVATYRPGYETLYLNGREHKMIRIAKKIYVFQYLETICGKYAYSFFVLFPLGFFSYLGLSIYRKTVVGSAFFSLAIGTFVLGIIWAVPIKFVGERGIDFSLLGFGALVVVVSVLTSVVFRQTLKLPRQSTSLPQFSISKSSVLQ